MNKMNKKKKSIVIIACVLAAILVLAVGLTFLLYGIPTRVFYSDEQHVSRVRERAEARYLGEGSPYNGLEVYPLYDENEKLTCILIELQPSGYVYVRLNSSISFAHGEYSLSWADEWIPSSSVWMPYHVKEGAKEEIIVNESGQTEVFHDMEFIRDADGNVIRYNRSPYQVAGIENERRYFLESGAGYGYVPAVKREGKFLDLVDGSLIDDTSDMGMSSVASLTAGFIVDHYFDL